MYHHSYTLSVHNTPIGESYNVIFNSENEIPTEKEFYNALKENKDDESKEKILKWKFSYKCHVIFKIQ